MYVSKQPNPIKFPDIRNLAGIKSIIFWFFVGNLGMVDYSMFLSIREIIIIENNKYIYILIYKNKKYIYIY